MPGQIVLIRHAEKPRRGDELNERGWERARALPEFFEKNSILNRFGAPVAIYAAEPKDKRASVRMIQTVTPLAEKLKIQINRKFHRLQLKKVLDDIRSHRHYTGKTVVICWPSEALPQLAQKLGLKDGPKRWPKKDFDRAWVLSYSDTGEVTQFKNIPQKLLKGDSEH